LSKQTSNETSSQSTAASVPNGVPAAVSPFVARLVRIRGWAVSHWMRNVAVAAILLLFISGTVAAWLYLARLSLRAELVSLETALATLDEGRRDEARSMARAMLDSGLLDHDELGGPLFVLGAAKAEDAESEATPEKRRAGYLVASRYLQEARLLSLPPAREADAIFLLGKSLLKSNQFEEGIEVLEELLTIQLPAASPLIWRVHRLLGETYLFMPHPDLEQAKHHLAATLSLAELDGDVRNSTLLLQVTAQMRAEQFDDARHGLSAIPSTAVGSGTRSLLEAEIAIDEVLAAIEKAVPDERANLAAQSRGRIEEAIQSLQNVESLPESGELMPRASYLLGCGFELAGQRDKALRHFAKTRQLHGDAPEALAAMLAEADLLRANGDDTGALLGYRRLLEGIPRPSSYRSTVMPLARVREKMLKALADFVEREKFAEAISLLAHFSPLFSWTEQLAIRGQTLRQQGDLQLSRIDNTEEDSSLRTAGLRHLRQAGVTYEHLAELRFGMATYTDDLWNSAEDYFRGQSFSDAARVLNLYLDNELELRNAEALLRLGQAELALGKVSESIAAFEECIEFHPLDPSTYQARLDCAKASWDQGDLDKAERLLRDNIAGGALKPSSREWKDSLFVLGMLLHEKGQYEEAIDVLEEATERYPNDSQQLLAQYVIGESYRRWAGQLLDEHQLASTDTDRNKTSQLIHEQLGAALNSFESVQRSITLRAHDVHDDPFVGAMLRNCYMFEATVLFDMGRYDDAIKAYSNVSSLYPNEPFVLETFVQIAHCWQRLRRSDKARGAIQQAQIALDRMPGNADFASATCFSREEWQLLLNDMSRW